MRVYIFANEADHSIKLIIRELKKRHIPVHRYYYKNISIVSGKLFFGSELFSPEKSDRILLRSPWNTPYFSREYTMIARYVAETYPDLVVFDAENYRTVFPFHQDKLYQGLLYKSLGIPTPEVWYFSKPGNLDADTLPYPIVIKRRISARSRSNYLISSKEELLSHMDSITLRNWLFQEYIPPVKDIRVNILKGKVLYALELFMQMKDKNRMTVLGGRPLDIFPRKLKDYVLTATSALKADFVGIDFIENMSGEYNIIEANMNPQFNRAQEVVPIDTVKLVTDAIVSS